MFSFFKKAAPKSVIVEMTMFEDGQVHFRCKSELALSKTVNCLAKLHDGEEFGAITIQVLSHNQGAGTYLGKVVDPPDANKFLKEILPGPVQERPLAPRPANPPSSSGARQIGTRYQILDTMLTCRFSNLLRARDLEGGSLVLRHLSASITFDERARRQVHAEGQLLSRMSHPNLPKVLKVLEEGGDIYLVLEDFQGVTLEQFAKQSGQLSADTLGRVLEQLLSVLEYLHRQDPPIIHRDIQPQSILITPDGTLKLAEFGLSKMLSSDDSGLKTSFKANGSPNYAAPEQLLGEPSDPAHDFYSVGAVLYYLATLSEPTRSLDRCLYDDNDPLQPLGACCPALPRSLTACVEGLLEPNLDKRLKSANAVRARMATRQ